MPIADGIRLSATAILGDSPLRWVNEGEINIVQGGTYNLANDIQNDTGQDEDYDTFAGALPDGLSLNTETGVISAATDAEVGNFDGWQPLVFTT